MTNRLQNAVEHAVAQVLEERLPALRAEIAAQVLQGISGALPAEGAAEQLNQALAAIQASTTQAEILAALLDGMARFCGRVALFVLRGDVTQGWQARGLADNSAISTVMVNARTGLAARAVQTRAPVTGAAAEFDARFVTASGGAPHDGNAVVIPLVVRDKVAGLIYADAGTQPTGALDAAAAELLVRATAVWVELCAARKTVTAFSAEASAPAEKAVTAAAAAASVPTSAMPSRVAEALPAALAVAPVAAPAPEPARGSEEEEVHQKARRFAKLLVEEIKLYNQSKVTEGRQKKDLWERLQTDIAKSRASYDKRYAQTAAASVDYFTQELIRILADGDASLLGSSFPG